MYFFTSFFAIKVRLQSTINPRHLNQGASSIFRQGISYILLRTGADLKIEEGSNCRLGFPKRKFRRKNQLQ
jgi:hypothetical protein